MLTNHEHQRKSSIGYKVFCYCFVNLSNMDKYLLEKYFNGEHCTEDELLRIEEYLDKAGEPEAFFFGQWKTAKGEMPAKDSAEIWAAIEGRIPVPMVERVYSWKRLAVAAAVLTCIVISGILYRWTRQAAQTAVWNKIDNTSKDIKYIRLEDGTEVWLNVHSSLAYEEKYLHNGRREIRLEGEAFFAVALDAANPFVVHTHQLKTTVLGTSFNIRAWPSQSKTQVALVSGKVRVSAGADSTDLAPGEVLDYDSSMRRYIVQERAVRGDMTEWVKGKIVLDNTPLPELLQQLEQIYNVTIVYSQKGMAPVRLSGRFRRDSIDDVLHNVLFPLNLTYSYVNGKYLVHKVTQH